MKTTPQTRSLFHEKIFCGLGSPDPAIGVPFGTLAVYVPPSQFSKERPHDQYRVVVSRERHGSKAWRPPGGFAFASHEAAVPLVGAEFAKVALEMPIGFVEISGVYAPVASMFPVAGRNFFIGPEGQWLGSYVPSALRAYPFDLRRINGGEEAVLCVDEDSGLLADDDRTAQSFFGADGNPSEAAKGISIFSCRLSATARPPLRRSRPCATPDCSSPGLSVEN